MIIDNEKNELPSIYVFDFNINSSHGQLVNRCDCFRILLLVTRIRDEHQTAGACFDVDL